MIDKNLFYHTRRNRLKEPVKRGLTVSSTYKRDGVFNNEASVQGYGYIQRKADKNIFFRRAEQKRLQPILQKRVFKDLDPQTRAMGSLDLTKEERRAGQVVEGIEATRKLLDDFIKTPRMNADGSPVLGIDGKPEFEHRSLAEILQVSQEALFGLLKGNNVVPSANLTRIIYSFTHLEIKNVINKLKAIVVNDPAITQAAKNRLFKAVLLVERLRDMEPVEREIADIVGQETTDQGNVEDNWAHVMYLVAFPFRGFTQAMWTISKRRQMTLKGYVSTRENRTANQLMSLNGARIVPGRMGTFFAMNHVLDLQTLRFYRHDATSVAIRAQAHP